MAKELPYFQFEPAQYMAGSIQDCSYEAQAIFINLCAIYWQRDCDFSRKQLQKKFNKNTDALDELIEDQIISYSDDKVVIKFLNEQYGIITNTKVERSNSGKVGNLKRWHEELYNKYIKGEITLDKALSIAKESHSDSSVIPTQSHKIREDKIREDKIREDKRREDKIREDKRREDKRREDNTIEILESDLKLYPTFEDFWNEYDKKTDKLKAKGKWGKLDHKTKMEIIEYIPNYKISQPDKKYRKDPSTFLNNKSWENELILDQKTIQNGNREQIANTIWEEGQRTGIFPE